jgi:hypothetical protein
MLFRFPAFAVAGVLATLLFASPAIADDSAALPEWMLSAGVPLLAQSGEPIPKWSVTALVSAEMLPRYSGASSLQVRGYPLQGSRLRFRH